MHSSAVIEPAATPGMLLFAVTERTVCFCLVQMADDTLRHTMLSAQALSAHCYLH
jgi:hypothetical protein